ALQPVLGVEGGLHRVHLAGTVGEPLDGRDLGPVGLGGEHGAGLDRLAVQQHRARTAGRAVAANVGGAEVCHVAQEVHKQCAVGHLGRDLVAVDLDRDLHRVSPFCSLSRPFRSLPRPPNPSIAAHTLTGVVGMSMCRTPRWLTASTTAFWTAGVAPIVPASPIPFTPSGLMSVGVSLCTSSKLGSSAAVIAA